MKVTAMRYYNGIKVSGLKWQLFYYLWLFCGITGLSWVVFWSMWCQWDLQLSRYLNGWKDPRQLIFMPGSWFCLLSESLAGAVNTALLLFHVSWTSHSMLARDQESESRNYQSYRCALWCPRASLLLHSIDQSKSQGQPRFIKQVVTSASWWELWDACTEKEGIVGGYLWRLETK